MYGDGSELVAECDLLKIHSIDVEYSDTDDSRSKIGWRNTADLIDRVVVSRDFRCVTKDAP
jgi:hypothetical protein